jgi:hypothetical protein
MRDDLTEIGRTIRQIRNFTNVAEYKTKYGPIVAGIAERLQDAEVWYVKLQQAFDTPPKSNEKPAEERKLIKDAMITLRDHCDQLKKIVSKIDTAEYDTTKAEARNMGIGIRFLSINDLVKFFKDGWEDLNDMWKRAQDRRVKAFGDTFAGALRKVKTGSNTLDNYVNGFYTYHKRRYSGTEVEAANKWKDGMDNEDNHSLLDYLRQSRNKDAIRGIITLLCSRGEMDWSDVEIWKTLNALSRYQIPIEACKRDDVLRDAWLRKVCTDIWDDREIYYGWRQQNDSSYDSGKSKYTAVTDQISNVSGGMKAELAKQLKMLCDARANNELPPQDVKPQLYEEVLTYAMRNGKMSMEDKFYYLVMGIHHGILSIERLRVIAGEKGEILGRFPFIDYFYGKNNTMAEIHRMAARLQEDDVPFGPGLRTTMFLYYDVARSESVRARVSKVLSRAAENIDHEDIPFIISQIDWNTANNLADVISGSRQKVTVEGWKNSYVGFNTFMKIQGDLVAMDDAGKDRFTKSDADSVARTITSYIYLDNILTKNGTDRPDATSRPSLEQEQLDTTCPSGGPIRTKEWRNKMNGFIAELLKDGNLGQYFPPGTLTYKKSDGSVVNITLEQFAPILTGDKEYDRGNNSKELKIGVYNATKQFSNRLREILASDPQALATLKRVLRDHTGNLEYENAGSNSRGAIVNIMSEWNRTPGYKRVA